MKRYLLVLALVPFWAQAGDGKYIAQLGDCTACHTAPDGDYMAGGVPFNTPFGQIYSTNITPDTEHGIGSYSFAEFDKAMRKGIAREGHALYPAMPYPNYALMSEADMRALYDYLQKEVAASTTANRDTDISWPFSMRWPLRIWNALFVEQSEFKADPSVSEGYNRGAYLVQGLGHCGACHTPRGWAMQELGHNETHPLFLSGAKLDGWYATDLRSTTYSVVEMAQLLTTGRSNSHAVSGPMIDVITHSTQFLKAEDAQAIGEYLNAIGHSNVAPTIANPALASDQITGVYMSYCAECHGRKGEGVPSVIPALAQNPTVLAENASSLLQVLLNGSHSPRTQQHIGYAMPGYGWNLNDQQLADMANYLRSQWGNKAGAVSAADVEAIRTHESAH